MLRTMTGFEPRPSLPSAREARSRLSTAYPMFVSKPERLTIVGAGPEGRRLIDICRRDGVEVAAVLDDNPAVIGQVLHGMTVQTPSWRTHDPLVPVVICSHRPLDGIRRARGAGLTAVPFALLQIMMPDRFPPHPFYDGLLEDLDANRAAYEKLRDRLADDRSRMVLDRVLEFRSCMNPVILADVIEENPYHPAGLFQLGDDEVYVDGGTFDGDSVTCFVNRVHGKFNRIHTFEPDTLTFARLCAAFPSDDRIRHHNAGLWKTTGLLRFQSDASRLARLDATGDAEVPVVSLDDVLGGDRVTYIKMNIEGAEREALQGARRSIATWHPRLALSAYHRPSDLWELPKLVDDLASGYRFHLRQHDGGIVETVLYALPGSMGPPS